MKLPREIEYVDLANNALDAVAPSGPMLFVLRHFQGETFRPAADEAPHRHNYQELFIVQSGHGKHAIDGEPVALLPRTVSLISKGRVHVVEQLSDFTAWMIRFSDDFLPTDQLRQTWNDHSMLFQHMGRYHTLTIGPAELEELAAVLMLMEAEWHQPTNAQREQALRHLLSVLIIRLERIYQHALGRPEHQRDDHRLYQQFMTRLEYDFAKHHDVQHYALALQIAPHRLARVLRRMVEKSTKQLIDERIVLEAKRYLHYSDGLISEIAADLGYSDVFHFSKTFKRITGQGPQAFREQRQKLT